MTKCLDICPGQMRHRLRIERRAKERLPSGGWGHTWQPVDTVPAKVQPTSGRDQVAASRLEYPVERRAWVRYRMDLEAEPGRYRIIYKDRPHVIGYALDVEERHRFLELGLTSGVAT